MTKTKALSKAPFMGLFLFILILILTPSFAHAQSSFYTYMERCEELRPEIEQILKEEGLPDYFFYLALAESGCDPSNKSNKNALGLFQLVPYTFKVYSKGVCNSDSFEACPTSSAYDPLISTRVAAKYLKSLYDRFDKSLDWTVAAFNAGGTNLMRKTSYYKGMDIKVVKKYFPQAYDLVMKVRRFSALGEALEEKEES
jgi:soluble lytic murein transglycosylase-like protein